MVEALLAAGSDMNKPDQYRLCPLHHAAMRGNIRVVECLASKTGITLDVTDDQNTTPHQIAATYGNKEVVRTLLEKGARVNVKDYQKQTVLHRAAKEGNHEIVDIILDHLILAGNEEGEECDGDSEIKTLMTEEDTDGNTHLMLAVLSGTSEAIKIFIEKGNSGSYIRKRNNDVEYPLHLACR